MMPMWVYLTMAAAIAALAFAIGQLLPGAGALFAVLATSAWVAYSVTRHRRLGRLQ